MVAEHVRLESWQAALIVKAQANAHEAASKLSEDAPPGKGGAGATVLEAVL